MLTLQEQAEPTTPASGYQRVFIGLDGILRTKDDSGTVRVFGVGTATELATTGDPVVIDSGAAPNPGDILVATAGPVSPIATWQNPGAANVNTPYLQTTLQTGAIVAAWGELIRVDVTGGDATISLPTAVGSTNRDLGVKLVGAASGNTITISPFPGQFIDGAPSFVMSTDNGTLVLRSDGANVMEWT